MLSSGLGFAPAVNTALLRFGHGAAFVGELLFCVAVVLVYIVISFKGREELSPSFGIANAGVTIAGIQCLVRVAVVSA